MRSLPVGWWPLLMAKFRPMHFFLNAKSEKLWAGTSYFFGAASVGAYHASNFANLRYARGRLGLRSVPGRRAIIFRRNSRHVRSGFSTRIVDFLLSMFDFGWKD